MAARHQELLQILEAQEEARKQERQENARLEQVRAEREERMLLTMSNLVDKLSSVIPNPSSSPSPPTPPLIQTSPTLVISTDSGSSTTTEFSGFVNPTETDNLNVSNVIQESEETHTPVTGTHSHTQTPPGLPVMPPAPPAAVTGAAASAAAGPSVGAAAGPSAATAATPFPPNQPAHRLPSSVALPPPPALAPDATMRTYESWRINWHHYATSIDLYN